MSNKVLTPEDVLAIRDRLNRGEPGVSIARDFAISQQTVSGIKTGAYWGRVTGLDARAPGEHTSRGKLSREDVMAIDDALEEGVPPIELARRYGVSHNTIYLIRLGRTWAWLTGRTVCERRTK